MANLAIRLILAPGGLITWVRGPHVCADHMCVPYLNYSKVLLIQSNMHSSWCATSGHAFDVVHLYVKEFKHQLTILKSPKQNIKRQKGTPMEMAVYSFSKLLLVYWAKTLSSTAYLCRDSYRILFQGGKFQLWVHVIVLAKIALENSTMAPIKHEK